MVTKLNTTLLFILNEKNSLKRINETLKNWFRPSSFNLAIIFFLINSIPYKLESQTNQFDTVYQTNNEIIWLRSSNDYMAWRENVNGEPIYFRLHNGILESRSQGEEYSTCMYFDGLYVHNDFLFVKINDVDGSELCNRGLIWGENSFIEDSLNIDNVCAQHGNLLLQKGFGKDTIIDISANTKKKLNLENAQFYYTFGNICSLNDSIVNIKAGKYEKNTDNYLGEAIIQYNWRTDFLKELFFSNNFLHFINDFSEGKSIAFNEQHPSSNSDSTKLYFYDGQEVKLIAQRYITNGYAHPYLDGVVFISNDSLFYWENDFTALLSDAAFQIVLDGCKMVWGNGSGENGRLKLFNGTQYIDFPFNGYPDFNFGSLNFNSDTSFMVAMTDIDVANHYILTGNHNLNCVSNCDYPDVQILEGEKRSYLKTKNITSQAHIDNGNTMYKSTNTIRLLPGFRVEKGNQFIAKIENCNIQSFKSIENEVHEIVNLHESYLSPMADKLGKLEKNFPNPFYNGITRIRYFIPVRSNTAKLTISNFYGQMIESVEIENYGNGEMELNLGSNANSIYFASLEVDGKIVDSLKMISIKNN